MTQETTMRTMALAVIGLMAVGGCASLSVGADRPAADVVVSPAGNDTNPGTAAAPLATIAAAQQRVRAIRATDAHRDRPVVVEVRGGTYRLTAPLAFTAADSGTPTSPTVYEAAPGERPVLSGGVAVTNWRVTPDGRWHASLPDVKSGKWNFIQLWANDQRRFRPRLPAHGHYAIVAPIAASPKDGFVFNGEELRPSWANLGDVEVLVTHKWTMSRLPVLSVDAAKHEARVGPDARNLDKKRPYFVENVKEALGEPGSWYLDRPTGELTYVPEPGETPDRTTIVAPRLAQLVTVTGESATEPAAWITLRGLTLAHANWVTPKGGQHSHQSEVEVPGAVSCTHAEHVMLDGCAIRNIGPYAVELGAGCADCVIERCEMVDLGAGGVKVGTLHQPRHTSQKNQPGFDPVTRNSVRDCTIAHGGRILPAACGVWIGYADHTDVEHNDITDLYYTGVSVGWTWGYAPNISHDNYVNFNRISLIGQGVLSDMGGVYTLGISPGTTVDDNVIHDVDARDYGGWGLYTDEGSTDIEMARNLVYRTTHGGFHQHYGKDNHILNNIFIDGRDVQLKRTRVEDHNALFFQRNIVCWTTDAPLWASDFHTRIACDHNLYWNPKRPVTFPESAGKKRWTNVSLAEWQKKFGEETGSIVADPLFVDAAHGDYRLKPDSPAIARLGFVPLKSAESGRITPVTLTTGLPPVPAGFER